MLHSKSSSDFDLSPLRKASRLLNSVNYIWIEQIIASSGVLDVAMNDQGNDEEAVRARLIIAQEQVMSEFVVVSDCVDVGDELNEDPTKLHRYCIKS